MRKAARVLRRLQIVTGRVIQMDGVRYRTLLDLPKHRLYVADGVSAEDACRDAIEACACIVEERAGGRSSHDAEGAGRRSP
jgi:hypothetical protein